MYSNKFWERAKFPILSNSVVVLFRRVPLKVTGTAKTGPSKKHHRSIISDENHLFGIVLCHSMSQFVQC